jgi:glycerol-3-phosphate dehydrogenase (NAD(P)+)
VLITRGIVEVSRVGTAMGAKVETFGGLSGIGDLVVTCTSEHSRNKRAGYYIGQGMSLQQALDKVRMIVEAVSTVGPALAFAGKHNITMPITEELFKILYEGKNPKMAVKSLMERDRTYEF